MGQEIINLLESINTVNLRALADWLDIKFKDDHSVEVQTDLRLWANKIDQASDFLKQQPTAGDFTKKAREYCNSVIEYARFVKDNVSEETKDTITKKLFDLLFEGFNIIDTAEAEKKELLELCEEFMEIADDGSARFDDPQPGSIFLRAKAVIARAKKEG